MVALWYRHSWAGDSGVVEVDRAGDPVAFDADASHASWYRCGSGDGNETECAVVEFDRVRGDFRVADDAHPECAVRASTESGCAELFASLLLAVDPGVSITSEVIA